jgi:mRNA interferase RelE/StbE
VSYRLEISKSALKALASVPEPERAAIESKIRDLATEPRPPGCKKLRGRSDAYRIRHGSYRVIYSVDDKVRVAKVEKIGHRKDVYA